MKHRHRWTWNKRTQLMICFLCGKQTVSPYLHKAITKKRNK